MQDDAAPIEAHEARIAELEALAEAQAATIATLRELNEQLQTRLASLAEMNERLAQRVGDLERQAGQHSGNSGKPPSRDPAAERQRQAEQREQRKKKSEGAEGRRRQGKQRGTKGSTAQMSPTPDVVVDHRPARCAGCGGELDDNASCGFAARQVIDLPEVTPVVTEHRAHRCRCACGQETAAAFPEGVRSPVSYGPRVRAVVAYLLGRQHIPNRRVAEAMADLFGLSISTGAIDSIYSEAARRLGGFIAVLVALLRSLPVLHADETTDRLGTANCWMHVVSTGLYTLIHASRTRGGDAIDEAGVLRGYRGVIVHDRLAMYWKLKAKHGVCGAHLLRDLAEVALVASQTAWAVGLAGLLVETNRACEDARRRGLKRLGPTHQRSFAARYDALVATGRDANPEPGSGRKRNSLSDARTTWSAPSPPIARRSFATCTTSTSASPTTSLSATCGPPSCTARSPGASAATAAPSASPTYAATCPPPARTTCRRSTLSSACSPAIPGCRRLPGS